MERISEFTHWVGLGLNPGFAIYWASLMAQTVENLPAMQETQIPSLGKEDLLEKEMAVHSSYSCMENSMDRGAWQTAVHGASKSWTQPSD